MKIKFVTLFAWDSYYKASKAIASCLDPEFFDISYVCLKSFRGFSLEKQKKLATELGDKLTFVDEIPPAEFYFDYDVVHSSFPGGAIEKITRKILNHSLQNPGIKRPLTMAGYCGVVYENFLTGYLDRSLADILYVNSKKDFEFFNSFSNNVGWNLQNLLISGFPIIKGKVDFNSNADVEVSDNILFACQPTVPSSFSEREYIVKKLIDVARAYPSKKIILKPRHKRSETTFHKVDHHYHDIFNIISRKTKVPSNFEISYTPIAHLLEDCHLMLTVSSTAAIEAIGAGVKVGILTDFGVAENYGTSYFIGSGLFTSFDKILSHGELPKLKEKWANDNLSFDLDAPKVIEARILHLIETDYQTKDKLRLEYLDSFRGFKNSERAEAIVIHPSLYKRFVLTTLVKIFKTLRKSSLFKSFVSKMRAVYRLSN